MNSKWVNKNNDFYLDECSNDYEKLPLSIYKTNFNPRINQIYLTRMETQFSFPYKIYGIEKSFINRVVKTYHHTTGNLGILLNGIKGTGKTVTAELICNELALPVIIIQDRYDDLANFINNLQQDVILFFDEYEKIFPDYSHDILSVMDGVLSNEYRKTFLLTTNRQYLNDNMLQRPSRIRYVKHFKDLPLEAIIEIIEDKLERPEFKEDLLRFISSLEIITVDIVKSLVEEVNIHNESPNTFKGEFNVNPTQNICNVYYLEEGKSILKYEKVKVSHHKLSTNNLGQYFTVNGNDIGEITSIIDDDTFVLDIDHDENEVEEALATNTPLPSTVIVNIQPAVNTHKFFKNVF
jgi:hypothetical protein